MRTEINLPQWGMTLNEGMVTSWLKKVGDKVEKGDALCEAEEAKVADVVEAPISGVLVEILVEEGNTVPVLTPICVIE